MEKNNIDHLFRSKLSGHHTGNADDAAMNQMESLLSSRKKRGGAWLWIPVVLLALMGSALLMNLERTEGRGGQSSFDKLRMTSESQDNDESAVGSMQSAVDSLQSAVGGRQSAVGSGQSAVDNEQSAVGSGLSAVDSQQSISGEQKMVNEYEKKEMIGTSTSDENQKSRVNGSEMNLIQKTHATNIPEVIEITPGEQSIAVIKPLHAFFKTNVPEKEAELKRIDVPAIVPPVVPPPPPFLSAGEIGFTGGSITPIFKSSDPTLDNYITRRKNDEHKKSGFGADITLVKDLGNWSIQSGASYFNYGEDVQYSPEELNEQTIEDNSYWEYSDSTDLVWIDNSYWQLFYDSIEVNDTSWVWNKFLGDSVMVVNTTYMEYLDSTWVSDIDSVEVVITDSTFVMQLDTTTTNYMDSSLTIHNGITSIKVISIPIFFGYTLFPQQSKWNITLKTGVEFSYIIAKTGYYINRTLDDLVLISEDKTYRNIMINGMSSIQLRRTFDQKFYVFAEPGIRYGLNSMNKDFGHSYRSYQVRVGVGLRF